MTKDNVKSTWCHPKSSKGGLCWPLIRMFRDLASFLPLHIICLSCPSDTIPGYEAAGSRLLFSLLVLPRPTRTHEGVSHAGINKDWVLTLADWTEFLAVCCPTCLAQMPGTMFNRICFFDSSLPNDSPLKRELNAQFKVVATWLLVM